MKRNPDVRHLGLELHPPSSLRPRPVPSALHQVKRYRSVAEPNFVRQRLLGFLLVRNHQFECLRHYSDLVQESRLVSVQCLEISGQVI